MYLLTGSARPSHRSHELKDTLFVMQPPTLSANHQPLVAKAYNTNINAKRDVGTGTYCKSMRLPISATNYRLNESSCVNSMSAFGTCLPNHRVRVLRAARLSRDLLITLLLQFEDMMHAATGRLGQFGPWLFRWSGRLGTGPRCLRAFMKPWCGVACFLCRSMRVVVVS